MILGTSRKASRLHRPDDTTNYIAKVIYSGAIPWPQAALVTHFAVIVGPHLHADTERFIDEIRLSLSFIWLHSHSYLILRVRVSSSGTLWGYHTLSHPYHTPSYWLPLSHPYHTLSYWLRYLKASSKREKCRKKNDDSNGHTKI